MWPSATGAGSLVARPGRPGLCYYSQTRCRSVHINTLLHPASLYLRRALTRRRCAAAHFCCLPYPPRGTRACLLHPPALRLARPSCLPCASRNHTVSPHCCCCSNAPCLPLASAIQRAPDCLAPTLHNIRVLQRQQPRLMFGCSQQLCQWANNGWSAKVFGSRFAGAFGLQRARAAWAR